MDRRNKGGTAEARRTDLQAKQTAKQTDDTEELAEEGVKCHVEMKSQIKKRHKY